MKLKLIHILWRQQKWKIENKMKKGQVLMEVMLSISLFAILGLVCLDNYIMNINLLSKMKQEINCFVLAQKEIFLYQKDNKDFTNKGYFDYPYDNFYYQTYIEGVTISDSPLSNTSDNILSDTTLSDTTISDTELIKNLRMVLVNISGNNASLTVPVGVKKLKK